MDPQFTAELWAYADGPGSWHFVILPIDVADDLRGAAGAAGPPTAFGSIRVRATVGSTTWLTSLFPESQGGSMVLPVKKAVRVAEGLVAGDRVGVRLGLAE